MPPGAPPERLTAAKSLIRRGEHNDHESVVGRSTHPRRTIYSEHSRCRDSARHLRAGDHSRTTHDRLRLPRCRDDVDGLTAAMSNTLDGTIYPVHRLTSRELPGDVCHDGTCVDEQIANNCSGFVSNYSHVAAANTPLDVVMGYHNAADVPVYD